MAARSPVAVCVCARLLALLAITVSAQAGAEPVARLKITNVDAPAPRAPVRCGR